jgi:hypothetical protein
MAGDAILGAAGASWAIEESGNAILLGPTADGYVNLGGIIGARTFTVPDAVWAEMTPTQQWAANQAFLDGAVNDGATIALGSNPVDAVEGSYFWKEINYLKGKGYTISADGSQMVRVAAH